MLFASKDCVVEVSSDDEGFKGSYYRAILEDNPTESGHGKLKVRYLTLFNEDGSAPLTEIVDQSFIRPEPPEDLINGVVFERGLVVDAYFKNGWWTGVINGWWTGVIREKMKDEKYWVNFNSPGKMKNLFEKQQLRVHLDWTGLKWVRPDRKELIKSDFSSGTMVELRVGFVWVPAVMVKELENEKRFIVYVKCFNDSFFSFGGITKVITVDSRRVRPMQPPFSVGKYDLLDHVDFFDSEWCQGVVRGILFEGRYMVSFGKTKEASQFNHSELRPSMEWEDGVWHRIPKPKRQKEAPDSKRNKSVAETRNVQMKEPLGNEMADAVVNEKGSGSHVTMGIAATENKPQGKISPGPMRKQNGLGNESTREMMPEEHNYKCYTRKRKRRELEHNADPNETVLSSDRTPNAKVLPFTKKSPFWKAYESMEVFKRVPQSPHFNPLFETREDFREGFALGMIVTYSGLLEKLKDLETDVPISQLDGLKDSFSELEKHGFDVTMPLSRIDKLLERKDRQLSILEELKGFDKERTNGSSKSWKAKQEIDETERKVLEVKHKILELQRQEAALKEQKEAAEEQKDAIYEKICHVESCTRDLDVKLKDVEFELETIISAPW